MSDGVKAEFYALYEFKRFVEQRARTAASLEDYARDLHLPRTAFTKVPESKTIHEAWKTVCDDRTKEAEALHKELNNIATMLGNVMEAYDITDAEMAKAVARAGKLR
jgi:glutaredoxin 2